jgi:hypothetical protein
MKTSVVPVGTPSGVISGRCGVAVARTGTCEACSDICHYSTSDAYSAVVL